MEVVLQPTDVQCMHSTYIFSSSATIIKSARLFLHFIDLYRGSIKLTFHNLSEKLIFQETNIIMRVVFQNQTFRKESLIAS